MIDLRNLEVSAAINFSESAGGDPIEPLAVHYLRLEDLYASPDMLARAIENHLEATLEAYSVSPDTTDPETLAFNVLDADQTTLYRAAVSLHSRSLEPRIDCEQWGITDIAHHQGITAVTVRAYLSRGQMPQPNGYISGTPWWDADRIRHWERPRSRRLR